MIVEHPNDLVRDQYVMRLADRLDIAPDRLRDDSHDARSIVRTPSRPDVLGRRRPRSSIGASSMRCAGRCRRRS